MGDHRFRADREPHLDAGLVKLDRVDCMATRGFVGRAHRERDTRLPPGQYDVGSDWPVLTAEATPRLDPARWTLSVAGLRDNPTSWTWADLHGVPPWPKLGPGWRGVSVALLLDAARPKSSAAYVLATSPTGYTTNLPLSH